MDNTLKGLCDILDKKADRAFRAVPARETVWGKAFMSVLKGRVNLNTKKPNVPLR